MKYKEQWDVSDSYSEYEMCVINVPHMILAPQPTTDITRQPGEIKTE